MFELVTQNLPLFASFIAGTLVPYVLDHFHMFFFSIPDEFATYVNTTLVPRFGDKGGKVVLVSTQLAVMLIKQIGKTLLWLSKTVLPLVLSGLFTFLEMIQPLVYLIRPVGEAILGFLEVLWGELLLFFVWTKEAVSSQFVKFFFHIVLLYGSIHLLFFGVKRFLKKLV